MLQNNLFFFSMIHAYNMTHHYIFLCKLNSKIILTFYFFIILGIDILIWRILNKD